MDDHTKMADLTRPYATVSDRIRALNAAGYSRAKIATFLGKGYTHVRNVVVNDERRRAPAARAPVEPSRGVSETPAATWLRSDSPGETMAGSSIVRLMVGEDGGFRLPPHVEAALGYRRGGVAIGILSADRLELLSTSAALKRAQETVRRYIPAGSESLADSLIADRRREAAAEQDA